MLSAHSRQTLLVALPVALFFHRALVVLLFALGDTDLQLGAHLSPLNSASSHVVADPIRTRKLLLNAKEIENLAISADREGYTLVPLELYWKNGRAKLQIGIAKGKKQYDKRAVEKERDWQRDKQRLSRMKR